MDSSLVQTLKTAETIGQAQYDAFVQERLILCEEPLTDTIPKQYTLFKLELQGGYLEVSQAEEEATSTDKPISNRPKNISEKGYRCVCLNARSIVNKKNELNIMVEDTDPHIIGITESWANIDITYAELGLTGYVMFRKDRIGRRGGGVILYVKESIEAYEIKLEREADCNEAVWCKIV